MKRSVMAVVGALALVASAPAAAGASTARQLHSGTIQVFVEPTATGTGIGPIIVTGAFGDHGTTVNIDVHGAITTGETNYALVRLKKGSFRVNLTTINKLSQKTSGHFFAATCSFWTSTRGPIQLFDGTGAYQGLSGSLVLTETFGAVLQRLPNGKCSMNTEPAAQMIYATGSGKVTWG